MPWAGAAAVPARMPGDPEVSLRAREQDGPRLPRRPAEQLAPVLIAATRRAHAAARPAGDRPEKSEPRLELVGREAVPGEVRPAADDDPVAAEPVVVEANGLDVPVPPAVQRGVEASEPVARDREELDQFPHYAQPPESEQVPVDAELAEEQGYLERTWPVGPAATSAPHVPATSPRLDDTVVMEPAVSVEPPVPAPVQQPAPEPFAEPPAVRDRWWDGLDNPPDDWAMRPERRTGRWFAVLAGVVTLGLLGAAAVVGLPTIWPSVLPHPDSAPAMSPAAGPIVSPPRTTAAAAPQAGPASLQRLESSDPASGPADSRNQAARAPATRQAAAAPAPGPGGAFAVYLISVRPAAQVAVTWRQLADRYPELAGLQLRPTRPVEVAGVGTLYAVEAGALETRDDAQVLCDRLRAQGQSCRVLPP